RDTVEFAALLAKSPSVERCLARKLLQYSMGRALASADDVALDDLASRFGAAGRTYAAAITALATSPAFGAAGASPSRGSRGASSFAAPEAPPSGCPSCCPAKARRGRRWRRRRSVWSR